MGSTMHRCPKCQDWIGRRDHKCKCGWIDEAWTTMIAEIKALNQKGINYLCPYCKSYKGCGGSGYKNRYIKSRCGEFKFNSDGKPRRDIPKFRCDKCGKDFREGRLNGIIYCLSCGHIYGTETMTDDEAKALSEKKAEVQVYRRR